jgi:hypothetical protein
MTLATLIPALPVDLVHIALDYAPGVALDVLSAQERIEVVRRLTGLVLSDERASLILEQRDAGNRDFDDLQLATDEDAWCEALEVASSLRAVDELVRIGRIKMPLELSICHNNVMRILGRGGCDGLALLRCLERMGPSVDAICRPTLFHRVTQEITHAPTIQYLLHRLLDANDSSFALRKQQLLTDLPNFAQTFLVAGSSPLDLLVFQIYRDMFYDEKHHGMPPMITSLLSRCPEARTLLLHLDVLRMMTNHQWTSMKERGFFDVITDARPPDALTLIWSGPGVPFSMRYGSFTRSWHPFMSNISRLCEWIVDDWLSQAQQDQWTGFATLLDVIYQRKHLVIKLIQNVPDQVLVQHITQKPTLLGMFCTWPSVPSRLLTLISFDTWLTGLAGNPNKGSTHTLLFFDARHRVLLRRS